MTNSYTSCIVLDLDCIRPSPDQFSGMLPPDSMSPTPLSKSSDSSESDCEKRKKFDDYLHLLLNLITQFNQVYFLLSFKMLNSKNKIAQKIVKEFREKKENKGVCNFELCSNRQILWMHFTKVTLFTNKAIFFTRENDFLQTATKMYLTVNDISVTQQRLENLYCVLEELTDYSDTIKNSPPISQLIMNFSTRVESSKSELFDDAATVSTAVSSSMSGCTAFAHNSLEEFKRNSLKPIREISEFYHKTTSGSSVNDSASEEEKESFMQFVTDPFYVDTTAGFFKKIAGHFKNKSHQDAISFVKSVRNLTKQHVEKVAKKDRVIDEETIHEYFLYILHLLCKQKLVTGVIYSYWVDHSYSDTDEMAETVKIKIDTEGIEKSLENIQPEKKEKESKKQLRTIGDSRTYACICYSVLKTLSLNNFNQTTESQTTFKKYVNLVDNLLKNLYSSRRIEQKQKLLLREDKQIKFIIMEILNKMGIVEKIGHKIEFNQTNIEELQRSFDSQGKEIIDEFEAKIRQIDTENNS